MAETFASPRNDAGIKTRFNTPRTTQPSTCEILKNPSRRLYAAFKSPLRQPDESLSQTLTEDEKASLEQEIKTLKAKEIELDKEVASLLALGFREEELNCHIQKLHDYNEIKDIGQMLLGRIAVHQGVTTKDLYQRYNLSLDD